MTSKKSALKGGPPAYSFLSGAREIQSIAGHSSGTALVFVRYLWHNSAVPVWLEKFGLPILVAAFVGVVVFNALKLDRFQRVGIGITIVGLSIFFAQTVNLQNKAKAEKPTSVPEVSNPSPPTPSGNATLTQPRQIIQKTDGPGSPAVQNIHGDVNISVDQSGGEGKPKKPPGKKQVPKSN